MAAEPYVIANPKENNVILSVTRLTEPSGTEKTLALIRPGESYRADLPCLTVKQVPLPARLVQDAEGQVRPDPRKSPPRLAPVRSRESTPGDAFGD